jgi:hypothetical protein
MRVSMAGIVIAGEIAVVQISGSGSEVSLGRDRSGPFHKT